MNKQLEKVADIKQEILTNPEWKFKLQISEDPSEEISEETGKIEINNKLERYIFRTKNILSCEI